MFCALFLALIYPAPALAFSSHYAFCWLIVPPLPDVLIMSAWIRTSSPFNLLLHALILRSFEFFLITVNSRKSSCRVFGLLALFRGYGETEKGQILCRKPGTCAGVSAFLSLWDTGPCFIPCCCSVGTNLLLVTSAHFIKQVNKPFPGDGMITSYSLKYMSSTYELTFCNVLLLCIFFLCILWVF